MQVREKHKTIKSKTGNLHSNSPDPTVQNPQNRKIFQCHILERYVSINFSGKTIVLLIYLKIKFELDMPITSLYVDVLVFMFTEYNEFY